MKIKIGSKVQVVKLCSGCSHTIHSGFCPLFSCGCYSVIIPTKVRLIKAKKKIKVKGKNFTATGGGGAEGISSNYGSGGHYVKPPKKKVGKKYIKKIDPAEATSIAFPTKKQCVCSEVGKCAWHEELAKLKNKEKKQLLRQKYLEAKREIRRLDRIDIENYYAYQKALKVLGKAEQKYRSFKGKV